MILKRKRLSSCKLYLILDAQVLVYDKLLAAFKKAVVSGVDIIQLRDKLGSAADIMMFIKRARSWSKGRVLFIVNDRVDIAYLSSADGVHLGQRDLVLKDARKILGKKAIIGCSCQTIAHLQKGIRDGADYAGFGSVYKTLTKPDRLPMDQKLLRRAALVADKLRFPLFAIGGIQRENIHNVVACGVQRVAVCRDILLAKDLNATAAFFRQALEFDVNQILCESNSVAEC
jgi:thiamine-phosphate pyrophosphorylase